ncbi:hypothetical protein VCR29J2_350046 [Vibrio coralliirubri]|nr:hypothetical protein VCR29J2_350046 [Vibrio coralliirubri]
MKHPTGYLLYLANLLARSSLFGGSTKPSSSTNNVLYVVLSVPVTMPINL